MKERPILFSGPMVIALLKGTKRQTRRRLRYWQDARSVRVTGFHPKSGREIWTADTPTGLRDIYCPYGRPGERLWVRETFANNARCPQNRIDFRADEMSWLRTTAGPYGSKWDFPERLRVDAPIPVRWKPGIHMHRWASRITLEVTDVRVQRLQDISEADARAEGCAFEWELPTVGFERVWRAINGDASWVDNPWVWAVSFKRVP